MRILVLYAKSRQNSYTDFLFRLWLQFFSEQQYIIRETTGFAEARQISFDTEKAVLMIRLHQIKSSFFYKLRLQSLIKKHRIKWLVQISDDNIIRSGLPQLIITNHPEKLIYNKAFASSCFGVCSEIIKQKLTDDNSLPGNIIQIIPMAADNIYRPISWSEQQTVKMEYTQGREYFVVHGYDKTPDSFTSLLKAFSAFKKWQHSSMKLVVPDILFFIKTEEWREKLNTYKYRDDIVMLSSLNEKEQVSLLASAYAFIHTPSEDNDVIPLLQAMQCETPCISFTTGSVQEYVDDAILIERNNYDSLSEKMILLYKDENLRSGLIAKGTQKAQFYTKEKSMTALRSALPTNLH